MTENIDAIKLTRDEYIQRKSELLNKGYYSGMFTEDQEIAESQTCDYCQVDMIGEGFRKRQPENGRFLYLAFAVCPRCGEAHEF